MENIFKKIQYRLRLCQRTRNRKWQINRSVCRRDCRRKKKSGTFTVDSTSRKVDIAQTIAVGDGANDLPMLGVAGLGIAFHAKPKVVANAKQSINTIGLDGVLYF